MNITFTEENHSKEWTLESKVNGMNVLKEIGFLTSTPIILTLHKLASSILLSAPFGRISLGASITVSGSISPPHIEETVTLTYRMPNSTLLVRNVTSTTLGKFEDTFIPEIAGSWTVKASWSGDLDHEGAESSEVSFTVKEIKVPKPVEFKIMVLLISPAAVKAGEKVMISVNITNVGEAEGTYTLSLKINGVGEATREVTLAGEASRTETFTIIKDVAGDYTVEGRWSN